MNKQMASSSVPNTPPVTDVCENEGFFSKLVKGVTGVASAATGAVKSGVGAVASAVTPSDASANPSASAAALPPATQVAAARYNRSVKKLKAESKKLMNVIEGKTRKSHKKAGAKAKKTPKTKKGGKHNKKH